MRLGFFGLAVACVELTALRGVPIIAPASIEAASPKFAVRWATQPGVQRRWRRSKGVQAKPRKRSNRMHVSRRTRRKHRRAA